MIEIKIEEKELSARLRILAKRGDDLRPVMSVVSHRMLQAVQDNFESEGRPDKWKPLSPVTVELRRKKGQWPGKILNVSQGGLAHSIQAECDAKSATVGSTMASTAKIYSAIQNFGGQAGRGRKVTIPAREFMNIPDEDMDDIMETIGDFINR